MVLTKMKETAEAYLGHKVTHAVVTVPACTYLSPLRFHRFSFCLVQTSTTLSARLPKMPEPSPVSWSSVSSTSLPPLPSPTVSTRRVANLRSLSTIWEEELLMFHFSPSMTVSSRSWPPPVIPILEEKISTTASSSTSSSRTRRRPAPTSARTSALSAN